MAEFWSEIGEALLAFAVLFAVFLPLERLFARHAQPVLRREYLTDLLFFAGQYLVWTGVVVALLTALHLRIDRLPLQEVRDSLRALPFWAQALVAVIAGDVCIYWGHRLSHRFDFLWRFHRVHHTAERLDWIAAYREHPLDNLYTRTIENLPALLFGFPLEVIAGFATFRGLWGLFIHSNTRLSIGPLKYVLGSPELHHWHHELEHSGRCNFANLMPLMDLLFGTFHAPPDRDPERYGIPEDLSHNYFAQLIQPFVPERLLKRTRPAGVDSAPV